MSSPRLLVTESDPFFASFLLRQLRQIGFEVVHAAHGEEALELLREQPFDLALTELMLPRMDGYQLIEAIRGEEALRDLPIFVLSRLGTREDVQRCREHGIMDYFIKPHHRVESIAERLYDFVLSSQN